MRIGFRLALVVLVLGGLAADASAGPQHAANTPLALAAAAPHAAAQPPAGMQLARTIEYTTAGGQTLQVRLFANSPEQRKRMESIAERLQRLQQQRMQMDDDGSCDPEDGANCIPDDGGWTDSSINVSVSDMIALACAAVSGTAQATGYVNIWIDAGSALCSSFTIVDLGSKALDALGNWIYDSYLASVMRNHPSSFINIWSLIDMGKLPIY